MRVGNVIDFVEPMSPLEVKKGRLLPYEVLKRYGFETNANGNPAFHSAKEMPARVRAEYETAMKAYGESERAGTLKDDYPQQFRPSVTPFNDLVCFEGLILHESQL